MNIDLTTEETLVLKETLTGEISELGMEIGDTDQKDFREHLKRRKAVLIGLLDRLQEMAA